MACQKPLNLASGNHWIEVWQSGLHQLASGSKEIAIPMALCDNIGPTGLSEIAAQYSELLHAQPSILFDATNKVVRILPPPDCVVSNVEASLERSPKRKDNKFKVAKSRLAKVPRPPNAFILYRQHHHPGVRALFPEFHNNDISILLGRQWKEETEDVKKHFQALAEKIKAEHARKHPNYEYHPRKPCQKKKRANAASNVQPANSLSDVNDQHSLQQALPDATRQAQLGSASSTEQSNTPLAENIGPHAAGTFDLPYHLPMSESTSNNHLSRNGWYVDERFLAEARAGVPAAPFELSEFEEMYRQDMEAGRNVRKPMRLTHQELFDMLEEEHRVDLEYNLDQTETQNMARLLAQNPLFSPFLNLFDGQTPQTLVNEDNVFNPSAEDPFLPNYAGAIFDEGGQADGHDEAPLPTDMDVANSNEGAYNSAEQLNAHDGAIFDFIMEHMPDIPTVPDLHDVLNEPLGPDADFTPNGVSTS